MKRCATISCMSCVFQAVCLSLTAQRCRRLQQQLSKWMPLPCLCLAAATATGNPCADTLCGPESLLPTADLISLLLPPSCPAGPLSAHAGKTAVWIGCMQAAWQQSTKPRPGKMQQQQQVAPQQQQLQQQECPQPWRNSSSRRHP